MNVEKVMNWGFEAVEHKISDKDCMLYSLGLGLGEDPCDPTQLQFVYENGLKVFPSMAVVVAHPGPWVTAPELEINWLKLLHGEQSFELHAPMHPGRTYVGNYAVRGVVDKGSEKGAILFQEKTLTDKETGEKVATVSSSYFCRGDGGCGGSGYQPPPAVAAPQGKPTFSASISTLPQAALIYRLSGDRNPIHGDPAKAAKAGFERPILHGLCTLGIATRALLDHCCEGVAERLGELSLRFSAPVYPGEPIQVDIWQSKGVIQFEARVPERGVTVLKQGVAKLR